MLLALALYASTAHANVPHYDLNLLYHDGRAHRFDKRLLTWLPQSPHRLRTPSDTSAGANLVAVIGAVALSLAAAAQSDSHPNQTGNDALIAVRVRWRLAR